VQRSVLVGGAGVGTILAAIGIASMAAAVPMQPPPSPVVVSAAPATQPSAPPPHLTGTDLLSGFYGKRVSHLDSSVLRVLIVTTADPVSSHLDWSYDSAIESLRRALEHSGYVIDRFWLPWRQNGDTAMAKLGVADSFPAAQWPGVVLFRKRNPLEPRVVLAYLVGEVPTSGVHSRALRVALDERRRLLIADSTARWSDTLHIVGPTFSGSALSLRRAIENWRDSTRDTSFAQLVTGSASDSTNLSTLKMDRASFGATVHTSTWLETAAESLIVQRLGIRRSELAFLHEGTTQYGQSAATSDTSIAAHADSVQPLRLSFPMNISSLRAQYAQHPVAPPQPAGRDAPPAPTPPRLALDQREPASLTESPAVLSQLTAPSVEILVSQIERSMVAHHIRAVGILATDIRDELFLVDEIRQRLHDVQIFFYGSNALFLRSEYRAAVNGSLVLSTYPLFLENQYWDLTKNDDERLIFASDQAEGLFNAVLFEMGNTAAMTEYVAPIERAPARESVTPPTWVTVVGRNDMYPVTLASDSTRLGGATERRYMVARQASDTRGYTERAGPAWKFLLLLLLLLGGFVASLVVLQRRTAPRVNAIVAAPSDVLVDAKPTAAEDRLALQRAARWASLLLHRELYVLLRFFSLFVGFSGGLLLLMRPRAHGITLPTSGLIILGAVSAFWAVVVLRRAVIQSVEVLSVGRDHGIGFVFAGVWPRRRDRMLWFVEVTARVGVLIAGLSYFLLTLVFLGQVMGLDERTSAFFFQRAVSVAGGVSPAVPIVLAAAGFVTWCSWHLMRITLLAEPTVFEEFLLRRDTAEFRLRSTKRGIREFRREAEHQARAAIRLSHRAMLLIKSEPPRDRNGHDDGNGNGNGNGNGKQLAGRRWRRTVSPDDLLVQARAAKSLAESAVENAERLLEEAATGDVMTRSVVQQLAELETPDIHRAAAHAQQAVGRAESVFVLRRGSPATSEPHPVPADHPGAASGSFNSMNLKIRFQRARRFFDNVRGVVPSVGRGYTRFENWYDRSIGDDPPLERSSSAARDLSDSLFYMIPSGTAFSVFVIAVAFAIWLASQFELSLEALILPRPAWLGGITSFDALFRFGTIALVGVTAWGVFRLLDTWSHVRTILKEIEPDLLPSLVALPPKLARVTRLTPFGHMSRADIEELVEDRWKDMRRALDAAPRRFGDIFTEHAGGKSLDRPPLPRSRPYELNWDASGDFSRLHQAVEWCRESGLLTPMAAPADPASPPPDHAERNSARRAADLYAVFIADYVDWVFQHLRYLASFLLVALVLTIVLLSSYPFQPQSVLKVIYAIVLVGGVGSLLLVIVQMNRDDVLSAISNTEAGTVSWDPQFISAVATYGAVPLITLISTESPAVREFLFSWVTPLLRIFSKG
jgi:hypothetical protein